MALETGTATDFWDLFEKFRTFITSHADLVSASQEWSELLGPGGVMGVGDEELVVEGPGLAGSDTIRVGLRAYYDAVSDYWNIAIRGFTTWNGSLDYDSQENASDEVIMHFWDDTMDYTFVADGRSFKIVAQVSSTVTAGMGGFFLPYALPGEYPYPMVIGGASDQPTWRYSETSIEHSHFINPHDAMKVHKPSGTWGSVRNFSDSSGNYTYTSNDMALGPYNGPPSDDDGSTSQDDNARDVLEYTLQTFGGGYALLPCQIYSYEAEEAGAIGQLDGVYQMSGAGNSHGTTVTIDSVDYMSVQNVFRNDIFYGFWALRLE